MFVKHVFIDFKMHLVQKLSRLLCPLSVNHAGDFFANFCFSQWGKGQVHVSVSLSLMFNVRLKLSSTFYIIASSRLLDR